MPVFISKEVGGIVLWVSAAKFGTSCWIEGAIAGDAL